MTVDLDGRGPAYVHRPQAISSATTSAIRTMVRTAPSARMPTTRTTGPVLFGPATGLGPQAPRRPGGKGQDAKHRRDDLQGGDHALVDRNVISHDSIGEHLILVPVPGQVVSDPQHPPKGCVSVAAPRTGCGNTGGDPPAVVNDQLREPQRNDRYPPPEPSPDR